MQLPWPFEDETFIELKAYHVLEHLPATTMEIDWDNRSVVYANTLINVMNEMWRILKPEGVLDIEVPIFPFWTAIADPTHVSPPFVPQTFSYFCTKESYRRGMRGSSVADDHEAHRELYGIKRWELLKAFRNEMGSVLQVRMKKA
jgi:SAM-dependent methyltransferase